MITIPLTTLYLAAAIFLIFIAFLIGIRIGRHVERRCWTDAAQDGTQPITVFVNDQAYKVTTDDFYRQLTSINTQED